MTNQRVTDYTALTGAGLANGDLFEVVDISDPTDASTGTNKKITKAELASAMGLSSAYIDGLGKVTETGFNGLPTLFDPASATWDQGTWSTWTARTNAADDTSATWRWSARSGDTGLDVSIENDSSFRDAHLIAAAIDDNGGAASVTSFYLGVSQKPDGSARIFDFWVRESDTHAGLTFGFDRDAGVCVLQNKAVAGQTSPLLDLQDSTGKHVVEIAPDGKVGGVAPSDGWSIKWDAAAGMWKAAA